MYSIVVPTCNRATQLRATVATVLAQETRFPYEVIVVDNNSSDDTQAVVRELEARSGGRVRAVRERTQGVSAARNTGIAAATGEIIGFLDDDVLVAPGWLDAIADVYRARRDAWCVGGRIALRLPGTAVPAWFDSTSACLTAYLSRLDLGDHTVRLDYPGAVWSANMTFRRDLVSRVGFFDPHLDRVGTSLLSGGEVDLCWRIQRAGGAVYYCGGASVDHIVPPSRMTKGFFRRRAYWQGRTDAVLSPVSGAPLWRVLRYTGALAATHCAQAWLPSRAGGARRRFEGELEVWWTVGYAHQLALAKHTCTEQDRGAAGAPPLSRVPVPSPPWGTAVRSADGGSSSQ